MIPIFEDHKPEYFPGNLVSWQQNEHMFEFLCDNDVVLRLYVHTDEILRFRYSTTGYFAPDFSYAIDPAFEGGYRKLRVSESRHYIRISTDAVVCHIAREGLKGVFSDSRGKKLCEEEKGFHWESGEHGGDIVQMSMKAGAGEAYFGLGDKNV